MYAFLSHDSAREVLRNLGNEASLLPAWPDEPRKLPLRGDCVATQRAFAALQREVDVPSCAALPTPVDLLAPDNNKISRGKRARFHVWTPVIPAHALLRLDPLLLVSGPEFVLLQMAGAHHRQQPVVDGFAKELWAAQDVHQMLDAREEVPYDNPFEWDVRELVLRMVLHIMEFAGTYRLKTSMQDTAYRLKPLMSKSSAESVARQVPSLYGAERVREALGLAIGGSASPMETALALMLALPCEYGGYGLPRPQLNGGLPTGAWEHLWDGGAEIHPDLAWPKRKVALEYDSSEFHDELGPYKVGSDAERANVLTSMGYTVLRATSQTLKTTRGVDRLAQQVAAALGCELAEPDSVAAIRRNKLFALVTQ